MKNFKLALLCLALSNIIFIQSMEEQEEEEYSLYYQNYSEQMERDEEYKEKVSTKSNKVSSLIDICSKVATIDMLNKIKHHNPVSFDPISFDPDTISSEVGKKLKTNLSMQYSSLAWKTLAQQCATLTCGYGDGSITKENKVIISAWNELVVFDTEKNSLHKFNDISRFRKFQWYRRLIPQDSNFYVVIYDYGIVEVRDINDGQLFHTFDCFNSTDGHSAPLGSTPSIGYRSFAVSNTILVTGSEDTTAKIWDIDSGECLHTLSGHTGTVHNVQISKNNKFVITGSHDCSIKIWNARSGKCLHTFADTLNLHQLNSDHIELSSNNKLLLARQSHKLTLWDAKSGQLLLNKYADLIPFGPSSRWTCAAISPDSSFLMTAKRDFNPSINVIKISSGESIWSKTFYLGNNIEKIIFSPDSSLVAVLSATDGTLYDTKTGTVLHSHKRAVNWPYTCAAYGAISEDNSTFIFNTSDKTWEVWKNNSDKLSTIISKLQNSRNTFWLWNGFDTLANHSNLKRLAAKKK